MTQKTYTPKLILHWQEQQEGFDYYGGFFGFFKKKTVKLNTHHEKEITNEQADFIVKNMPQLRIFGAPSTQLNLGAYNEYDGTFYCEGMISIYIEKRAPDEVQQWINKVLDK